MPTLEPRRSSATSPAVVQLHMAAAREHLTLTYAYGACLELDEAGVKQQVQHTLFLHGHGKYTVEGLGRHGWQA